MVAYKKKNLVKEAELKKVSFNGDVGELFDRFRENRITSDFAINTVLKEAEDAFFDKVDDIDAPLGRWRGEFWGKLIISACRVAKYKNSAKIADIVRNSAKKVISTADESGYIGSYKDPRMVLPCPREKAMEIFGKSIEKVMKESGKEYVGKVHKQYMYDSSNHKEGEMYPISIT